MTAAPTDDVRFEAGPNGRSRLLPLLVRAPVGAISGAVLVSALGAGVIGAMVQPTPAWFLVAFEAVIALAGAFGVAVALGRPRDGALLAVLCVAGCIGAGSLFGYLGVGRQLMGVSLTPFLGARLAAAALLVGLAGVAVLGMEPRRAVRDLVLGSVFGVPPLLTAALAARGVLTRLMDALPGPLGLIIVTLLAVAAGACLCASVHLLVRAFTPPGLPSRAS